jgi:hypothetical protein
LEGDRYLRHVRALAPQFGCYGMFSTVAALLRAGLGSGIEGALKKLARQLGG